MERSNSGRNHRFVSHRPAPRDLNHGEVLTTLQCLMLEVI